MTSKSHKQAYIEIEKLNKEFNASMASYAKSLIRNNPKYQELSVYVPKSTVRPKKPKGYAMIPAKIVRAMLAGDGAGLKRTQKYYIDYINKSSPAYGLSMSYWQRSLPNYERDHIKQVLIEKGIEVSLAGCSSLSDVKKALVGHSNVKTDSHTFKVSITFGQGMVTVGRKTYNTFFNLSKNKKYEVIEVKVGEKRQKIAIECLRALFKEAQSKA